MPARLFCRLQLSSKVLFEQPSKGASGFNVVAELSAPEKWPTVVVLSCQESAHPEGRVLEEVTSSLSSAHFNTGAAAAEAAREAERARGASRRRRRSTSVPATNSPTYHRPPGVDTSALPNGNGLRTATTAAGTSVPVQQQAPPVVPIFAGPSGTVACSACCKRQLRASSADAASAR